MIIADLPKGFFLYYIYQVHPILFHNRTNTLCMHNVEATFELGNDILHHDDVLLSILESTKKYVRTYAMSYEFKILMEWWGVNELHLACPSIPKER